MCNNDLEITAMQNHFFFKSYWAMITVFATVTSRHNLHTLVMNEINI